MIDSGVDGTHPVLAGSTIIRHGCNGQVLPAPHGTAVASLLAGEGAVFRGMQPRATVYAADVFCGHGGGSIALLAIALDWMAREKVPVVNISLVGARSVLLTGVDANDRVLPEACRGEHVDFAAPGAGIRAAQPGGGFADVRGTSFATPIVAGLLAGALSHPDPVGAGRALEELAATAMDLGRNGPDMTYGRGLVGGAFRPAGE